MTSACLSFDCVLRLQWEADMEQVKIASKLVSFLLSISADSSHTTICQISLNALPLLLFIVLHPSCFERCVSFIGFPELNSPYKLGVIFGGL
ncbi:hypothetical protein K1719_008947 [Acacia pycnantha]|nr:hypothetical protein K1719_008947 [Acacia pycnantha]